MTRAAKIAEYERFLGERLHPDLAAASAVRDDAAAEIASWEALATNLEDLRRGGREHVLSQVNLGCEVYCQAEVPDTSTVYINVGCVRAHRHRDASRPGLIIIVGLTHA